MGRNAERRKRFARQNEAFRSTHRRHVYSTSETGEAQALGKQMLRSGTSVGANYREAYRGRSKAERSNGASDIDGPAARAAGASQETSESIYREVRRLAA